MSSSSNRFDIRNEHPTGWLVLTSNDSVPYIIDALLDASPRREFNQNELAREAGVSQQSVARYITFLADVGIIKPIEDTDPTKYRFKPESPVGQALIDLDGAMNAAGADFND